jgi:hypothetical protein
MFVITADQIASRTHADLAGSELVSINTEHRAQLALPADRTAGDEIQMLTADPATTLTLVLELTRTRQWSVGIGVGAVRLPLPSETRAASGDAFFAARDAVTRAKKSPTRFAVEAGDAADVADATRNDAVWPSAADAESLINLLLELRERRSAAGWELFDLLQHGMTQNEAAGRLGITPPSASSRARAAALKAEAASISSLTRLLENLDRTRTRRIPSE